MELLLKELTELGYAAEIKDRKIKIKPTGLSSSIFISYDISLNQYVLSTHDISNSVISAILLFNGFLNLGSSHTFYSSLFMTLGAVGFLMAIMTEIKSGPIREYVSKANSVLHAAGKKGV